MVRGIVYVAFGEKARQEVTKSIASLTKTSTYPITLVCDRNIDVEAEVVHFTEPGWGARWAKLSIDTLTKYDHVLYLDADTRVHKDITVGFELLEDGFDLVLTASVNQGTNLFTHIDARERFYTNDVMCNPFPLQLQAGVFFFNRHTCKRLFEAWREEWLKYKGKDQAAFLRALDKSPVKVCLLGRDWNGGAIVEHLFGRAR